MHFEHLMKIKSIGHSTSQLVNTHACLLPIYPTLSRSGSLITFHNNCFAIITFLLCVL